MKVKVCGLTRAEDTRRAGALGAALVGFVLARSSPRRVPLEGVAELVEAAGAAEPVLVFRRCPVTEVLSAARATGVRRVQLHGFPGVALAPLLDAGLLVHRALDASAGVDARALEATERSPVHLDVRDGGSGRRFDWSVLRGLPLRHVFVAGGITPENVGEVVPLAPEGIDLSSGIESAPGVKDPRRMRALFEAVARAREGGAP